MKKNIVVLLLIFNFLFLIGCEQGDEILYPSWGSIYVANFNSGNGNTVSVFDGRTGDIIATTILGGTALATYDVAANPVSRKIYISNYSLNTVSVINGDTNSLIKTITNITRPNSIAINSVTNKIYVTNDCNYTVTVIDGSNDMKLYNIEGVNVPVGIAVNETTNKIYVTNSPDPFDAVTNTGCVGADSQYGFSVIDGSSDEVTYYSLSSFSKPYGVAVNEKTNTIYVTNFGNDKVAMIEGGTNSVSYLTHLSLSNPQGIAVNEETSKVYVVNNNTISGNSISIIDSSTNTVTNVLTGFSQPWSIAINSLTNKIYLSNRGSNTVSVIDANDDNSITNVEGFIDPAGVAVLP